MSEKLPYEEKLNQLWDELPLPDEDMAWKDMKRRLDEDDDDKIVVPPPKRGCGIGALLIGLLLLGGFWLLLRPEKWFMKKDTETAQQTTTSDVRKDSPGEKQDVNNNKENSREKTNAQSKNIDTTNKKETTILNENSENTSLQKENKQESETVVEIKTTEPGSVRNKPGSKNIDRETKHSGPVELVKQKNIRPAEKKEKAANDKIDSKPVSDIDSLKTKPDPIVSNIDNDQLLKKELTDAKQDDTTAPQKQDSITMKSADSAEVKKIDQPKTETSSSTKKEKDPKPIFFSAGMALHQQIPIAGQEWTTFGSLGRKGILSDYIPSINLRMEKEKRWFLQTEFRYGAPQHTKQFTYSQEISIDTITQAVTTNSSSLKKTFYHQVPITFNYYVLPDWSIGAGVQWNKFYSAVAEQDVARRRPGTTIDSVISKNIVTVSNDSSTALVKSWWQGVIQTQYQWKRFSIGARYSFGLQPYIRFTLPNQPLQEEKNSSLQLFLRYELWKSKK